MIASLNNQRQLFCRSSRRYLVFLFTIATTILLWGIGSPATNAQGYIVDDKPRKSRKGRTLYPGKRKSNFVTTDSNPHLRSNFIDGSSKRYTSGRFARDSRRWRRTDHSHKSRWVQSPGFWASDPRKPAYTKRKTMYEAPTPEDKALKKEIFQAKIDYGPESPEALKLVWKAAKHYFDKKEFGKAKPLLEELKRYEGNAELKQLIPFNDVHQAIKISDHHLHLPSTSIPPARARASTRKASRRSISTRARSRRTRSLSRDYKGDSKKTLQYFPEDKNQPTDYSYDRNTPVLSATVRKKQSRVARTGTARTAAIAYPGATAKGGLARSAPLIGGGMPIIPTTGGGLGGAGGVSPSVRPALGRRKSPGYSWSYGPPGSVSRGRNLSPYGNPLPPFGATRARPAGATSKPARSGFDPWKDMKRLGPKFTIIDP